MFRLGKKDLQFNEKDVIKVSKDGTIFIGGYKLTQIELKNLNEEIKLFKSLRLYSILFETIREQARLVMFERSKSFEDMRTGKAMLFSLSILENIFTSVEKTVVRNNNSVLK